MLFVEGRVEGCGRGWRSRSRVEEHGGLACERSESESYADRYLRFFTFNIYELHSASKAIHRHTLLLPPRCTLNLLPAPKPKNTRQLVYQPIPHITHKHVNPSRALALLTIRYKETQAILPRLIMVVQFEWRDHTFLPVGTILNKLIPFA